MTFTHHRIAASLFAGTALAACLCPSLANAQATPEATLPHDDTAKKPEEVPEVIVTGTLIRGLAPVGSSVIGINPKQIEESGATTSNELLAKMPQVGFFGTMPAGPSAIVGSNASNSISRPNLRNLPAAQTSGGAQTLVLIDGHRVVGAGTAQIGVDPDIIAPGAVQNVEALTDGGSAIYGSDALGGVINFITRKRFNGLDANARVGIGRDITTVDGYLTAGKDWGSGGLYVSYNYAHHDALYGSDRDYIRRINYATGVPVGRYCAAPNISAGGASYVVSGASLAAGGPNTCDQSDNTALYPTSTTHNVFARLNQNLNSWLSFDATVLWAHRDTQMNGGTIGSDNYRSAVTSSVTYVPLGTTPGRGQVASALYRPIPGDATGALPETITFNYGPVFGARSNTQHTKLDTWEVAPSFTAKLGGDWQLRTLASYGRSNVGYANRVLNSGVQSALLASGALNPFNIAASSPAALAAVVGDDAGYGRNELYNARAIVDGPLFRLPGGQVRIAAGAEYLQDNFSRQSSTPALVLTPVTTYSQNVKSVFGEAIIPIFGNDNGFDGFRSLRLSVSGRYDKYNDFGDTFNPKVGVDWKPLEWLSFRGNWGKSFNAPSPVDQLGQFTATATNPAPAFAFLVPAPPGVTFAPSEAGIFLGSGAIANLQPQKATTWSFGATIEPPFIPNLFLDASYYNIDLSGTLGRPVGVDLTPFWTQFPNLYLVRPTGQALSTFLTDIPSANRNFTVCNPTATTIALISASAASCGTASPVGAIIDTLLRNLGTTTLTGVDFKANYTYPTGFGWIDASVAGNLRLSQDSHASALAPLVRELDTNNPKLRVQSTLGATIGKFRVTGTWNHVSGYARAGGASAANFGQSHIDAFNTFDAYFRYDMKGEGLTKDLSFTLNIQNIFDQNPPLLKSSDSTGPGFDPTLAFTLGRLFQMSVHKKF